MGLIILIKLLVMLLEIQIHFWNNEIQKNNQNRSYILFSKNEFADIDDPYNNLKHSFLCENLNKKINQS